MEENIIDYLKDWKTDDILEVISAFCYDNDFSSDNTKRFIEENGLSEVLENHIFDLNNPDRYFKRSTWSDRSILEDVKIGLLSTGFKILVNERASRTSKSE
jgi:hypothetical protein